MSEVFLNINNFNHLINDITLIFDKEVIDSSLCESWLKDNYEYDKVNTARAVERYCVNLMIPILYRSSITESDLSVVMNNRLKFLLNENQHQIGDLSSFLTNVNNCRDISSCNKYCAVNFINNMEFSENILYLRRCLGSYKGENIKTRIDDENFKKLVVIMQSLKRLIITKDINSEEFKFIKESIERILYLFKEYVPDNIIDHEDIDVPGINVCEVDNYNIEDLKDLFVKIEIILESECEQVLDYVIDYLKYLFAMANDRESGNLIIKESVVTNSDKLDLLTEKYFGEDSPEELTFDQIVEYFTLFNSIESEVIKEGSSRIISKGTEKVARSVGNASARSRGMGNSKSKVDQIKRGARVIDDRASGAINAKIDDIINFTQEQKREKLITGKNTIKLSKCLKTLIGIVAGGTAAKLAGDAIGKKAAGSMIKAGASMAKGGKAAKVAGKVVGGAGKAAGTVTGGLSAIAITIIGLMVVRALSKNTEEREKKRILLELETELKIVKEKIEDARGDNNKQQKYELMRIQANLEKEITRIKHGLRYY